MAAKSVVLDNESVSAPRALSIDAGRQLTLLGSILAAVALALVPLAGLGWRGVAAPLAVYGVIAALVLPGLGHHAPHRHFGPANFLTLARGAYGALLLGVVVDGVEFSDTGRWLMVGTGTVALLLDGVDGWAARKTGLASRFGARFDMEVDALFVLALAALVWRAGQAEGWVLTAGLMRYIFVLAGWLWPMLAAPLAPSLRRKTICVVGIVVLLVALSPMLGPGAAALLCLAGLIVLGGSFAADTAQLMAAPRRERRTAGIPT
jgi:phosphatidylglycerophosphate synthase